MAKNKTVTVRPTIFSFPQIFFMLPTAMVGYQIHGSIFWSVMDFIFWPLAWCKWFIMHEVSVSIIKQAFSFFLV